MLLFPFLRIVDSCRIGLVRVMRPSLVCRIGDCLWLFTAVFVQILRWLAFFGAVILYTYTALTEAEICSLVYKCILAIKIMC
jgi:hypothetical protein